MASVMIFVPAYGNTVSSHTLMSLSQLQIALITRGIGVGVSALSRPDIEELRNIALSVWYDQYPEWTHLLMVDSDMGFPPDMVVDMLAFGQPVVGAVYRHKSDNVSWVYSGLGKDTPGDVKGPFVELEGVGAGVLLIARTAIDDMILHMPGIVDDRIARFAGNVDADKQMMGQKRLIRAFDKIKDPEFGTVSEDISFCRRWRECGGKVWGAAGYDVQHVGVKVYEGNFKQWTIDENLRRQKADAEALASRPLFDPDPKARAQVKQWEKEDAANPVFMTVDAKHGTFRVIRADTFIGRSIRSYGEWCEFELDLLLPLIPEGGVVYDVGANIGTHAVPFAKKVGNAGLLRAFECQGTLFDLLVKNLSANLLPSCLREMECHHAAVGRVSGGSIAISDLPPLTKAFNFGSMSAGVSGQQVVSNLSLDQVSLEDPRVDLIKIDVEGMEAAVIEGARNLIARDKPLIYVENNVEDCSALARALDQIGYAACWHMGPYFNPHNYFRNRENAWPTVMPSVNMICYPVGDPRGEQFAYLEPFHGADDNWKRARDRTHARLDRQEQLLTG